MLFIACYKYYVMRWTVYKGDMPVTGFYILELLKKCRSLCTLKYRIYLKYQKGIRMFVEMIKQCGRYLVL